MKIIQKLVDQIEDELEGAEEYAKCALTHKEDHPTLAKTFYDISTDEMRHVNLLHDEAVKLIEDHRREKGEPPAAMLAVWEYMHKKHIEKANKIKTYQAQYREG
jgi:ferritin